MSANPNWARWVFASVAHKLKLVATNHSLAVLVDHLDERTDAFMKASDRCEIRVTGPFSQELSEGYHRLWVDCNVLLTSRYDGQRKNAMSIIKLAGLFQEAMSSPIPIWNYGNESGDYIEDDEATHIFLGCLLPRPGNSEGTKVFHFGQADKTDKLKQTMIDARYVGYFEE